jgi:arginase family enzyme
MSLPGSPAEPRCALNCGIRSTTNETELNAMRAAAWHRHGIAAIPVDDITDPWLRQAITNEANRRWGRRQGGNEHGR